MHIDVFLFSVLHIQVPFPTSYMESRCLALNLSKGCDILRLLVGISWPLILFTGAAQDDSCSWTSSLLILLASEHGHILMFTF